MSCSSSSIAVVGVGLRLPGGIRDTEELWRALDSGKDFFRDEAPKGRFKGEAFYHPTRGAAASFRHRGGYYLDDDLTAFDASFFGISAAEASAMDPQQRHLLEVTFECMENAGLRLETLRGSGTGVFVATFMHDFETLMLKDPLHTPKYAMTGMGSAIASNRLSYFFDFRGPSVSIDTGCSGGLVAVHQACQSLLTRETDLCFAGASNLLLSPDSMIALDLVHLLNPEGRCRPFDRRGSGYGRGEGTVVFALKRLDDSLRDKDDIRGIIRSSVLGQDGRTRGITMPNSTMQQAVIERAYRNAGLDVRDTLYVEAHGTGTIAGDDAEVSAIAASFKTQQRPSQNLYMGSVKSNFGHLESASGLIGLLKCLLVLEKRIIAPNAGELIAKTQLDLPNRSIQVPNRSIAWPESAALRASLNSFGYGGTIAHLIVEAHTDGSLIRQHQFQESKEEEHVEPISEALTKVSSHSAVQERGSDLLFVLSGASRDALSHRLKDLQEFVRSSKRQGSELSLSDLAFTLIAQRSHFDLRHTFIASSSLDILDHTLPSKLVPTPRHQTLVFVFTGQGSQYAGMGLELFESSRAFADSLRASEKILTDLGAPWSLIQELQRSQDSTNLYDSRFSQPSLTAIQMALVDLYASISIVPDIVLGHSSGEIAAAYAAKILTMRDALKVAYLRGINASAAKQVHGKVGAMLAVSASEDDIKPCLTYRRVTVACRNSRFSHTLSGDADAIHALKATFMKRGMDATVLKTDIAYHSHHMLSVSDSYLSGLDDIQSIATSCSPTTTFVSSVGSQYRGSDFNGEYWVKNLTSPVDFYPALEKILQDHKSAESGVTGMFTVVEVGPHNVLKMPATQTAQGQGLGRDSFTYIPTMLRNESSHKTFLQATGSLFQHGSKVGFENLHSCDKLKKPSTLARYLPHYPWNHTDSYWEEPRLSREHRFRTHPYHDLLGVRMLGTTNLEPTWRHMISTKTLPWLKDHKVGGRLIFPGAAYLAMAIEAKSQMSQEVSGNEITRSFVLEDIQFTEALEVPSFDAAIELQISLRIPIATVTTSNAASHEFRIMSVTTDGHTTSHCHGRVSVSNHDIGVVQSGGSEAPINDDPTTEAKMDASIMYQDVQPCGHLWGPSFALIEDLSLGSRTAAGLIRVGNSRDLLPGQHEHEHVIHPTVLDAVLHSAFLVSFHSMGPAVMMPVSIAKLELSLDTPNIPGEGLSFRTSVDLSDPQKHIMQSQVWSDPCKSNSMCLVKIEGGVIRSAPVSKSTAQTGSTFDRTFQLNSTPKDQDHPSLSSRTSLQNFRLQRIQQDFSIKNTDTSNLSILDSDFEIETVVIEGMLSGLGGDLCNILSHTHLRQIFFISESAQDVELEQAVKIRLWHRNRIQLELVYAERLGSRASENLMSRLEECMSRCIWINARRDTRSCIHIEGDSQLLSMQPATYMSISSSAPSFDELRSTASAAMRKQTEQHVRETTSPRSIAIHLSALKDLRLTHQDSRSDALLAQAGLVAVDLDDLSQLVRYGIQFTQSSHDTLCIISGVSIQSLVDNGFKGLLQSDIFEDIDIQLDDRKSEAIVRDLSKLTLKDAKSLEEAQEIASSLLRRKIASFFSFDEASLDMNTPMEEFGLDSLAKFSLSSWLKIDLDVSMLEAQVIECESAQALVTKILQKSTVLSSLRDQAENSRSPDTEMHTREHADTAAPDTQTVGDVNHEDDPLPKQPLPSVNETQEAFLDGMQVWLKGEDQSELLSNRFAELIKSGEQLQKRLLARSEDRNIVNWIEELYTPRRFLQPRSPITPTQTYYGTHPDGLYRHTQARRAALICLSAYNYHRDLATGKLEDQSLHGLRIDPDSQRYFFNAARTAKLGMDELHKFDGAEHVIVLCRGQPFSVDISKLGDGVEVQQVGMMERAFSDILTHSEQLGRSVVGALTAGERDQWAKLRPQLLDDQDGSRILKLIESSLFVVCLDECSPSNTQQRFEQFLVVECGNRWFDKPLQFVVCQNGESATVIEHAAVDGASIGLLERRIGSAIASDKQDVVTETVCSVKLQWESFEFPRLLELETVAKATHRQRLASLDSYTLSFMSADCLGSSFFESVRFPIQSGIQLAIQLASFRFFRKPTFALETVSLAHFRHGRVETNPVIRPCMLDFLKAMDSGSTRNVAELKELARKAATEYTKHSGRAGRGKGFGRHLLALEWVLQPGEARPSLFDDPIYNLSKKALVLSSCFPSGWKEGGFVYPVPGGILVYFETRSDCIPFSIYGNQVNANDFGEVLAGTAQEVARILSA